MRFSWLCAHEKCPASLWLCPNTHHSISHNKMDYFYHFPHDLPPDLPIRDPFKNYDVVVTENPDEDYDEALQLTVPNDSTETRIIVAIVIFIILTVLVLCTYIYIVQNVPNDWSDRGNPGF